MAALRIASSLLPYALASVAVLVASGVALSTTVRPPAIASGISIATPAPVSGQRVAGLSDSRMAYWRSAASGSLELWVSDLDGGRRWPIASAGADADLALTRWSPDGSAVAYRTGNGTIGIVRLDGTLASLVMPLELRRAAWKIVSYEWSPDARRIAASFRAASGRGGESDVFVAEVRSTGVWQRVTTLGDAYPGPWIDDDRLFVETSSGLIATLDLRTKDLRPITGLPAASPQIGRDGRVYFAGGQSVTADGASQPVATGWVWSATIDGQELRRESTAEHGQARLFGMLADGRAVIGVPGGVYLASDTIVPLVFGGAGSVRRVVVSEDGKRAIGITGSGILQIDPTRVPRALQPGALPPAAAANTLLSGIRDADVWTARKPLELARPPALRMDPPQGRLAFTLGHAVWEMRPDGSAKVIATEGGALAGRPVWSPDGQRVAAMYTAIGERQPSVLVAGPQGTQRWRLPTAAQHPDWTPDGKSVTFWIPTGTRLDQWNTHSFDAATGRGNGTTPGRVTSGPAGRFVLSDGEHQVATGTAVATSLRVRQSLDLVTDGARRTVTDAARLASTPLLKGVPDASRAPIITQVFPSADPEYVGMILARLGATQLAIARSPAFVVVRVSDGEPVFATVIPIETGPQDLRWSPAGRLVAWGVTETASNGAVSWRVLVSDPVAAGAPRAVEGRFGGWSADGKWIYIARDEGLYALRADALDADPVPVSPLGVVVSATQ